MGATLEIPHNGRMMGGLFDVPPTGSSEGIWIFDGRLGAS